MNSTGRKETTLSYWSRYGQVSLIRIASFTLSPVQSRTAWHISIAVDKRQFDLTKPRWHNNGFICVFLLFLSWCRQTIEKPNPGSNGGKGAWKRKRKEAMVIFISLKRIAVADDLILHMLDEGLLGIVCGTCIGFDWTPV